MIKSPLLLFIAALICAGRPVPAVGQEDFNRPQHEAAFELSISQEFGENAKPAITVTTSIPYRRLIFFMRGQRYEARYRVYFELKDSHGKRVRGDVWEESIATGSFRETTSAVLAAISRRTFPASPGEYRAAVTIEVIDTSRRFSEEQTVRVVGEGMGRLELSSPVFYTQIGDSLSPGPRSGEIAVSTCSTRADGTARINPGAVYGSLDGWARIVCSVVTPAAVGGTPFAVTARVRDARGLIVLYARKTFDRIEGGHASICLDINVDGFVLGGYEIEAVAETPDGAQKSEAAGRFTVLFNRSLLGARIADLVEILSIFADEKEARLIADAPPAGRVQAWASFWRKRDPTPSTGTNEAFDEFFQRLKYVLENFSKHQPGWRTDMGKIHIKNGAPDKVEDRQDERTGAYYRLWYYYSKGIAYVFEDAIGTGEYRLLTTEMI
jgi:GWxTD domain-containing protein